jgi:aldose 1-epimerase
MYIFSCESRIGFTFHAIVLSILITAGATGVLQPAALSSEKEELTVPSSRYSVVKDEQEGMTIYVLKDHKSGCEAKIVPEFGNNCFSYNFNVEGEQIDILDPPPSLAVLKRRASGYGIPILFPFPNRIREGKFTFEGQDYQFDVPRP